MDKKLKREEKRCGEDGTWIRTDTYCEIMFTAYLGDIDEAEFYWSYLDPHA